MVIITVKNLLLVEVMGSELVDGWEVSLLCIRNGGVKYKVTRRYPTLSISETLFFSSLFEAKVQLNEWLQQSSHLF